MDNDQAGVPANLSGRGGAPGSFLAGAFSWPHRWLDLAAEVGELVLAGPEESTSPGLEHASRIRSPAVLARCDCPVSLSNSVERLGEVQDMDVAVYDGK